MINYPGYETVFSELQALLTEHPPPFIFVQDNEALRSTQVALQQFLSKLCRANDPDAPGPSVPVAEPLKPFKLVYAYVDAISCFNPRILYERILHGLVGWEPDWEAGCANWSLDSLTDEEKEVLGPLASALQMVRWNESLDGFLHGLRAVHELLRFRSGTDGTPDAKGKGKEGSSDYEGIRFVIVISHPERVKEKMPDLLPSLTRLAELARVDLTIMFLSQVGWDDVRPPLGASPDPYYVDMTQPSKQNVVKLLMNTFDTLTSPSSTLSNTYHPALKSLYTHYATMVVDVCFPFVHDPQELQYIAAARWPGFVKPVIDLHRRKVERAKEDATHSRQRQRQIRRGERPRLRNDTEPEEEDEDVIMDSEPELESEMEDEDELDIPFEPPPEEIRIRLARIFTATFNQALETLYPRLTNAADWAKKHLPPDNLLESGTSTVTQNADSFTTTGVTTGENLATSLPKIPKFILIASFIASTNPPKSDMRMFGRGVDERKRRRRATKSTGQAKKSGPGVASKVSQRLLGPLPFAFDRMVAILGAIVEENDVQSKEWCRVEERGFRIPGEWVDLEVGRVGVYAAVMELTSMRLLHRTTPADRLDGPPMFKCAISYESTLTLAKQLDVPLNDLLWEPL